MTAAGWTIMLVSVGSVLAACGYCLYRVLSLPAETVVEHLHALLDLDRHDDN
jgi:hypothetical protein